MTSIIHDENSTYQTIFTSYKHYHGPHNLNRDPLHENFGNQLSAQHHNVPCRYACMVIICNLTITRESYWIYAVSNMHAANAIQALSLCLPLAFFPSSLPAVTKFSSLCLHITCHKILTVYVNFI